MSSDLVEVLSARIEREHQAAHSAVKDAIGHAIACGKLLIEAKRAAPHGKWLPWVEENLTFGARQAQNYMKLANAPNANLGAHLSGLKKALEDLREPKVSSERDDDDFDYERAVNVAMRSLYSRVASWPPESHDALTMLAEQMREYSDELESRARRDE